MPNVHIRKARGYNNLFSSHNTVTCFVFVTAAPAPLSSPTSLCVFVYVSFSDADISHLSTSQPRCVVSLVPDAPRSWRPCSLMWLNLISYTNSQRVWRLLADKRKTRRIFTRQKQMGFLFRCGHNKEVVCSTWQGMAAWFQRGRESVLGWHWLLKR